MSRRKAPPPTIVDERFGEDDGRLALNLSLEGLLRMRHRNLTHLEEFARPYSRNPEARAALTRDLELLERTIYARTQDCHIVRLDYYVWGSPCGWPVFDEGHEAHFERGLRRMLTTLEASVDA